MTDVTRRLAMPVFIKPLYSAKLTFSKEGRVPMTDDTIYCPCCDTPLEIDGNGTEETDPEKKGIVAYCVIVGCPLCGYAKVVLQPTIRKCWAIIEADMERNRRIG
ncbi:MAG: hypothetical protein MUF54_08235 [Polyangiaceae bacterium]|nr:hypothetical protein [Polyangiaceae bacterium]